MALFVWTWSCCQSNQGHCTTHTDDLFQNHVLLSVFLINRKNVFSVSSATFSKYYVVHIAYSDKIFGLLYQGTCYLSLILKSKKSWLLWLKLLIVSSALKRKHNHNFPTQGSSGPITVFFTIDKSADCYGSRKLAVYRQTERTYPAGAKLIVTRRERWRWRRMYGLEVAAKVIKDTALCPHGYIWRI